MKTEQFKELSKKSDQLAMSPTIQPGIDIESLDKQLKELEKDIINDFNLSFDNLMNDIQTHKQ